MYSLYNSSCSNRWLHGKLNNAHALSSALLDLCKPQKCNSKCLAVRSTQWDATPPTSTVEQLRCTAHGGNHTCLGLMHQPDVKAQPSTNNNTSTAVHICKPGHLLLTRQ
jgi:hypothetical protein